MHNDDPRHIIAHTIANTLAKLPIGSMIGYQNAEAIVESLSAAGYVIASNKRMEELQVADKDRQAILASTSWRITAPIRHVARQHPAMCRFIRRSLSHLRRASDAQPSVRPIGGGAAPAQTHDQAPPLALDVRTGAGIRIYVDPTDARGRLLVARKGDFNPRTLMMWRILLAESLWTHVVDVGANYGEMLANGGLPKAARVIALEPNPHTRAHLERSLSEAGITAEILPVAASDNVGTAELLIDRAWSGVTRLARPDDVANSDTLERLEVATTTLGELLADGGRPLCGIRALVKIDVEGHEIVVLKGVLELLEQLASFAALIEIAHLSDDQIIWLLRQFDMELYDYNLSKFAPVLPGTLDRVHEMLAGGDIYNQDAVLRRKARTL